MDWLTDNLDVILTAVAGMVATALTWWRKSTDDKRDNDRADFTAQLKPAIGRISTLESRMDDQSDEIARLRAELAVVRAERDQVRAELRSCEDELREARKVIGQQRDYIDQLEEQRDRLQGRVGTLEGKVDALRCEMDERSEPIHE